MDFTPEQSAAIHAGGTDILVSAAAGSGKTAVLTERIMRHIREGTSLDRLLVVTFTEAAAAEMRERIGAKLAEQFEKEPSNAHIARQLVLLPRAEVSTIHAFCRKFLKEHFQEAGLDPSFKVGDEAEMRLLQAQVMDELLTDEYEREDNAEILDLSDAFGGRTGDDRLDAMIRALFLFLESAPFPEEAARRYMEMYAPGLLSGPELTPEPESQPSAEPRFEPALRSEPELRPWADIALDELREGLAGALDGVRAAKKICRLPGGPDKYLAALDADEALIHDLMDAARDSFDAAYEAFGQIAWARIHTYRKSDMEQGLDEALKERAKSIRDGDVKDRVNKLADAVFFAPPQKMRADMRALSGRIQALLRLTLRYAARYAEEKRARNLLDFNDLEHFAIKVLNAQEAPRFKYEEVLIDEYQDSNSVQEFILAAVAGKGRRFMVGDVKQGIYRFRRANPKLFIEKYENYAALNRASIGRVPPPRSQLDARDDSNRNGVTGLRIDLSTNFRSQPHVLAAVNFLFTRLMSPEVGEIAYDARAALYPRPECPPPQPGIKPETWVEIASHGGTSGDTDETSGGSTSEEGEEISKLEREAAVIAKRVKELLNTTAYTLNDMVVLTRGVTAVAGPLTEALKRCGVDAVADLATGFYDTPEIKLALAFLRVTDNPRQDIDLIAVLHCAVYGLTPDELLAIRDGHKDGDYYDAVLVSENEKARAFLRDLEKWRHSAAYMPISRLIGVIFDDTSLPAVVGAMPGGRVRQANLRLLLERAIQYEETSFTGLFHFINYIAKLYAAGGAGSVSAAQDAATGGGKLRIMTIHKSKGLEFPIVFVSLLGKQFNREDERGGMVTHPQLGIGAKYTDLETRVRSNTIGRYALAKLTRRETMSEELRVLYVALTRAKEMLILTGCVSGLEKKKERWAAMAERGETLLPVYYRREAVSFLDWIMPCVMRENDLFRLTVHEDTPEAEAFAPLGLPDENFEMGEALPLDTAAPFDMAYPYAYNQPSKLSISELKRLFNDLSPDSAPLYEDAPMFEPPQFLREERDVNASRVGAALYASDQDSDQDSGHVSAPDSAPVNYMSASRMGTVLHTVAEHLDWHHQRGREDIVKLMERLVENNLLTVEETAAVDMGQIERLANSALAERIRRSPHVRREVPFVMRHDFYGNGEEVLTHGIIDCFFEEDGEAVLVDFKSGRVQGGPREWVKTFAVQMDIYKKAVEEATALRVKEVWVYSFDLGESIIMDMEKRR